MDVILYVLDYSHTIATVATIIYHLPSSYNRGTVGNLVYARACEITVRVKTMWPVALVTATLAFGFTGRGHFAYSSVRRVASIHATAAEIFETA